MVPIEISRNIDPHSYSTSIGLSYTPWVNLAPFRRSRLLLQTNGQSMNTETVRLIDAETSLNLWRRKITLPGLQ